MKKVFGLLLVLIIGYAGIFSVSRVLEQNRIPDDESFGDEDLYFSSPQLNLLGSDFKGLLADWYWIKSLQYMGEKVIHQREKTGEQVNINDLTPLNPRLVYPMLDSASTLDPQFMTIYSYGAAILPAINNEQAIKLLEKGIAANPNEWRLYNNLGYIYWNLKDYARAAEIYAEGASKPNAPVWMNQMSATMKAQGGSREFALQIYGQMFETAEDEQTRSFAGLRYNQVLSQIQLETVNRVLQNFKQHNSRCVNSLTEILPLLDGQSDKNLDFKVDASRNLVDPTGVPYSLDRNSCSTKLGSGSKIPRS